MPLGWCSYFWGASSLYWVMSEPKLAVGDGDETSWSPILYCCTWIFFILLGNFVSGWKSDSAYWLLELYIHSSDNLVWRKRRQISQVFFFFSAKECLGFPRFIVSEDTVHAIQEMISQQKTVPFIRATWLCFGKISAVLSKTLAFLCSIWWILFAKPGLMTWMPLPQRRSLSWKGT